VLPTAPRAETPSRAVVAAGQAVARAELGRLHDDWELRPQELPSAAVWQEGLQRAGQMGVVPASTDVETIGRMMAGIHREAA